MAMVILIDDNAAKVWDRALPPALLEEAAAALGPGAAYWREHDYEEQARARAHTHTHTHPPTNTQRMRKHSHLCACTCTHTHTRGRKHARPARGHN